MKKILRELSVSERKTFLLHTGYSVIDGIVLGVLALNEFVMIKGLLASNYQLSFLFQTAVLVLLFSVLFNELLKRIAKKKKMLRYVGFITRFPLLFLFFFPENVLEVNNSGFYQILFLLIFLIYYLAQPVVLPTINLFLKSKYSHSNFGKLFGYSTTAQKVFMLISTFLFGLLLDYDNYAFTYVYPILGILSFSSMVILSKIDFVADTQILIEKSIWHSIRDSNIRLFDILRQNKPFRDFELGFILYGFAWMATFAIITIFFEKNLHLNYSSIAFYKNSYNTFAIFLLPFFGKLIGKIDPRKFAMYTFSFMALHLFFMALTEYIPVHFEFLNIDVYYTLIISYIFYGLFTATMGLLWFIGSAYFCEDNEVADYQSIHLGLTGVRGILFPIVGVFLYEIIDYSGVFAISIFSLLLAVLLMFVSIQRNKVAKND